MEDQLYLALAFKNAKLFRPKKNSGDKVFFLSKVKKENIGIDRENIPFFSELITTHQVSNMLHVLFNERPVPYNRPVSYNINQRLFEMAENSYIKINKLEDFNNERHPQETTQIKKSAWNSWNPNLYMTWEVIRRFIGNTAYAEFSELLQRELDITTKEKFTDVVEVIRNNMTKPILDFMDEMRKEKKSPIVNYFIKNKHGVYTNEFSKSPCTKLNITTAIDKVIKLSGSIYIPVTEDDIEIIRHSKGCATLLDGGFVYIKEICDRVLIDGYTLMKDISTKTEKLYEIKN